jgi:taurine dioxygenase
VHGFRRIRRAVAEEATQDAIHPMVIRHPISKKLVLYVNPQFTVGIEGLHKVDGDKLLESLYAHALQPQFEHRFQWQDGSVVFWDNRFGWHQAQNDYPGERRLMHRITIEGCELESL